MLTTEERLQATQFNLRARQLFWRGILDENHTAYRLDGDALIDWVLDYQNQNGLAADGCLGPSTLLTIAAQARGGVGGFIIDGKEICVDGIRVARMFTPNDGPAVRPDAACILCMPEIAKVSRDRLHGTTKLRAHFAVDSSHGTDETSMIIQWADPMRPAPFCPTPETGDYPKNRQCVGIEMETFLLLYQIDADERHWRRRRPVVKAEISGKGVSQPVLYPQQIKALGILLGVLEKHAGIPKQYPMQDGLYNTALLDGDVLDSFRGCLAKYNYIQNNNEPGAGFAAALETLFGKLKTPPRSGESRAAAKDAPAPEFDASAFDAQRKELEAAPEPTSTFGVSHEEEAPFNLSDAIAAAYCAGKGARAARIAERCKKFDD